MNVYKLTTQKNNLIFPEFHSFRKENDVYVYKNVQPQLATKAKSNLRSIY